MTLVEVLASMGPYLLGRTSHGQTLQSLMGEQASAQDGERLHIYGEFCRQHRLDAVGHVFAYCRSTVTAHASTATWEELVERYFHVHPMHHVELNWNGRHFPAFLAALPWDHLSELPRFLPDLADFEWWEWQTYTAPDEPLDDAPYSGELRLASAVELRPYGYDLLGWLEHRETHCFASMPDTTPSVVLFWRDRDLDLRHAPASSLDLMILKAVVERIPLDHDFMRQVGLPADAVHASVIDLRAAGILCGTLPRSLDVPRSERAQR